MSILSVPEAAERIGVSERRVRQLIASNRLAAERKSGIWIIQAADVDHIVRHPHPPGRPLNPASAWALLSLASGDEPALSAIERSRARHRLARNELPELVSCLRSRAHSERFYAHRSAIPQLAAGPSVVRSGISAHEFHDVVALENLEAYVRDDRLSDLVRRYKLLDDAQQPNILFRVVAKHVWPFHHEDRVAPRPVVAVDLLEADDERSRRAGEALAKS